MSTPSLEGKTVRPGSLGSYSYYRSARQPAPAARPQTPFIRTSRRKLVPIPAKFLVTAAVMAAIIGLPLFFGGHETPKQDSASQSGSKNSSAAPQAAAVVAAPVKTTDPCKANTSGKLVIVSISQRHMWGCENTKSVHDAPVITGMTTHAETLTPPGTYKIYAKQADTVLTGSDSTGSWRDPVSYWMPFLDNQHGTYGFHDATWRADNAFGNVDPASADASHGCVELPLATSQWLYNWAPVGTTVTIES